MKPAVWRERPENSFAKNFRVIETKANLDELNEADEIFLTSAGIGIVRVAEFQEQKTSHANRTN
ncbi:MAG: hypothetical protein WKF71_11740 [Pyrinomonadaceae bacterium]